MALHAALASQAPYFGLVFALMKAWAGSLRAAVSGVRREGTSDMGSDAPDECLWGVGRGLLA